MNTKRSTPQAVVIFVALSIAGTSMAVTAQFVPNAFAQTVLVAIGSAIFGAGLAFFLVRIAAQTEK
jgi:ABC-type Fe3+ transport system permease subunit